MTTIVTTPAPVAGRSTTGTSTVHRTIPLGRIVTTELRKMFDTRSGFWLMASIGILGLLATGAVIAFSSDAGLTYNTFATAVGYPMTVVLPIVAILSVTSEWSQRSDSPPSPWSPTVAASLPRRRSRARLSLWPPCRSRSQSAPWATSWGPGSPGSSPSGT